MKRRIILILVILGILGGAAGGIYWYLRRGSGPRMLAQAAIAMQAGKFDRALELADRYVAKYPDDWHGYHMRAQALSRLGRYEEARGPLGQAAKLAPTELAIVLAMADTYGLPATRALKAMDRATPVAQIQKWIDLLRQANEVLATAPVKDPNRALDIRQASGMNLMDIGRAQWFIAEALERQAKSAEAAGGIDLRDEWRKQSNAAGAESEKSREAASKVLLEIVTADPARDATAWVLVWLSIDRNDQETLAAVRKTIEAMKDPPPLASAYLAIHDLLSTDTTVDPQARQKKIEQTAQLLDGLLKAHPDQQQVKLNRAQVAVMESDLATAERLCNEVLAADPRDTQARLLRAALLTERGDIAEAERQLYSLKTDLKNPNYPHWMAAQYAYAQAAMASGKKGMAREAMSAITKVEPRERDAMRRRYVAMARRYLAESLLSEGFPDKALVEAKAYYQAEPNDPRAISLFVRAASNTGETNAARQVLEKALADHPARTDVLTAVAESYVVLKDQDAAKKVALQAVDTKPTTPLEKLGMARCLLLLKRVPEAETIVNAIVAADPKGQVARYELARLYSATGRGPQSIEHYRAAVKADQRNTDYRRGLAQALLDSGALEEAQGECQTILQQDPSDSTAALMDNQIKMILNQPVSPEEVIRHVSSGQRGRLPVALTFLLNGQPKQCIDICVEELKKTPDSAEARTLLGQAYLVTGQKESCLEQWKLLLKAYPDNLVTYVRLAAVLSEGMKPPQVQAYLEATPEARPAMIDLAMGWLFGRIRQYEASAEAFGRVAGRSAISDFIRNRAKLLQAQALAHCGKADDAMTALDQLSSEKSFAKQALQGKVMLLMAANQPKPALAVLERLRQLAYDDEDTATLWFAADLYMRLKQTDAAMSVCDQVQALLPNDPKPFLLRALVLEASGKKDDAIDWYRKAIEKQPGNLPLYLKLADVLDMEGRSQETLDALKQLEGVDQTGQTVAIYYRGVVFARWGLQAQAVECFEKVADLGGAPNPRIQVALGQAFARLGQKPRAIAAMEKVPKHATEYIFTQQVLADLADTTTKKLEILDRLEESRGDMVSILTQRMGVLHSAGRFGEAVKVFRGYIEKHPQDPQLVGLAPQIAIQAMLGTGDRKLAADLSAQMAVATSQAGWRRLAILLAMDDAPDKAVAMLPEVPKADFVEASLGLCLAVQKSQSASILEWSNRVEQIDAQARKGGGAGVPAPYKLLVALLAGKTSQADAELVKLIGADAMTKGVAEELVASAKDNPKAPNELLRLLKSSLALDLGAPKLGREWAMTVLRARPTCQWAANLIVHSQAEPATVKEAYDLLQPKDCVLGLVIEASTLVAQKEYAKAALLYARVGEHEKNNVAVLGSQAVCMEKAGKLAEALDLYQQIWRVIKDQPTKDVGIANNAAYLLTQLYPHDEKRLAEAAKLADAALAGSSQMAAVLDTRGWIEFLQGRHKEALKDLRRAIKGLSDAPDAHYHLGMVEDAMGNTELARWHLVAAVSIGNNLKASGKEMSAGAAQSVKLAEEALAKIGARATSGPAESKQP